MFDPAVRTIGIALVLTDVLVPARGEIAAENEIRQLQSRISVGITSKRNTAQPEGGLQRARPINEDNRAVLERRQARPPLRNNAMIIHSTNPARSRTKPSPRKRADLSTSHIIPRSGARFVASALAA